jgi:arylsulfatase A-like enzyme
METVDDEILSHALAFIDKAKRENKPFFVWLNPTRMHVVTHLSEKYQKTRTPQNGWSISEAGMAQIDDIVGAVMQKLRDLGIENNTILGFTTDNGAENFTWPDGGQTPFAGGKGTALEGGFRAPMIVRWPGRVPAGKIENQVMSGLDWFPTLVAAAGNPSIVEEFKKGKQIGDRTYKAISTATIKRTSSRRRARRSATKSSISPRATCPRCASATGPTSWSTIRAGARESALSVEELGYIYDKPTYASDFPGANGAACRSPRACATSS